MAIDEKKLIEELKGWMKCLNKKSGADNIRYELLEEVIDLIEEQPKLSLETKTSDKWIPCSKEQPPKPEDRMFQAYIVQKENVIEPFVADWDGKRWWVEWELEIGTVLAWMPLPEPYKGE